MLYKQFSNKSGGRFRWCTVPDEHRTDIRYSGAGPWCHYIPQPGFQPPLSGTCSDQFIRRWLFLVARRAAPSGPQPARFIAEIDRKMNALPSFYRFTFSSWTYNKHTCAILTQLSCFVLTILFPAERADAREHWTMHIILCLYFASFDVALDILHIGLFVVFSRTLQFHCNAMSGYCHIMLSFVCLSWRECIVTRRLKLGSRDCHIKVA